MPNRYAGMYDDYIAKIKSRTRRDPNAERQADQRRQSSQNLGNLASVGLPILGAGIGGLAGGLATGGAGIVPGMMAGGNLGNMAGQAVGQHFYNQGESAMDPMRRKEAERMALIQAIMSMPRG